MIFMVQCFDKPNALDVRLANRPAHLEYLQSLGDSLLLAGPIMSSVDDMTPQGSLILIDVKDSATAHAFTKNDPYAHANLFEKVVIKPWVAAVGSWKPT